MSRGRGWAQLQIWPAHALQDGWDDGQQEDGQRDETETSTDPSHQGEPFFFLILILMNKVDQRAEPTPLPGPWRTCCLGTTWPETLPALLLAPGRVERALGVGTRAPGRGRGLAPLAPGRAPGVTSTYYLFFGFSKADGISEVGPEGPALGTVGPGVQPALSWAVGWPSRGGGPGVEHPSPPLPATVPFQCFPVWGRLRLGVPGVDPASQGLSLVPCP